MRCYTAIFIALTCLSMSWAKDMEAGSLHYNFSLYSLDALGTSPTYCDGAATRAAQIEWICGNYTESFEVFLEQWEAIANSDIVHENYNITAQSDWLYFEERDGSLDFYAKLYQFEDTFLLASYNLPDTPEDRTKIFIGVGAPLKHLADLASGTFGTPTIEAATSNIVSDPPLEAATSNIVLDPPFTSSSVFNGAINLITQASAMREMPCNEETDALAIKCGVMQAEMPNMLVGINMTMEQSNVVRSQGQWEVTEGNIFDMWYRSNNSVLRVKVITIIDNIHSVIFTEFAE